MRKHSPQKVTRFHRWRRKGWATFATLHRHVMIGTLSVGMSIVLLANEGAHAQAVADTTVVLRELHIDEVGISGRQSAPVRNLLNQTPLFDRKVAVHAPLATLEAALRLAPAIDLRERSSKGAQADISIRGGSPDQTMLLLNGVDFTDARTGHQSHAIPIDLDLISSVELLDGLPGVGAFAGAVNVRTAPLAPNYLRVQGEGGSHGYGYGNLSGGLSKGGFTVMAAASYRHSDGYRHNTDFNTKNAYLRATYQTRRAGLFDMQAGYQEHDFGSNGFYAAYNPDQWEATRTILTSLGWTREGARTNFGATVHFRKNNDRYDWHRGTLMNRHMTDHAGARLWGDYRWKGGTTTLGGDYAFAHIYSTNLGEVLRVALGDYTHAKARHTGNLFLRHGVRLQRFDASASAGLSFTPYGSSALWNLSLGYQAAEGLRLGVGAAQSMRLPTFTDLYYSSPAQLNNLDLTPERAVTLRLGAEYRRAGWNASLQGYYRAGRDIIDWVWHPELGDDGNGRWHAEQSSALNTYGVEAEGGYRAEQGVLRRATLSYAWLTTMQRRDIISRNAMDFLRHKLVALVELHFLRRCSLTTTATLSDRNGTYTDYPVPGDSQTTMVRAYRPTLLVDARLAWTKGKCRLYVDCTNLTNAPNCDMGGIPLPGRWLTGGMTWTFTY